MNDEKFIEQLNAYIDRELSGVEMREVETAIAASPERQKIYRDYCKIERACQTLLASEVKAPKPSIAAIIAAANAQSNDNVVPFTPAQASRPRISGLNWGTAFAGLAAACIAAVIYVAGPRTAPVTTNQIATTAPTTTRQIGPDDSTAASAGATYRTVFALEAGNNSANGLVRSAPDSFAWMNQLEFAPIRPVRVDSLQFKTAEPMQVRTLSAYAYPYPGLDDTPPLSESAAFQFQR